MHETNWFSQSHPKANHSLPTVGIDTLRIRVFAKSLYIWVWIQLLSWKISILIVGIDTNKNKTSCTRAWIQEIRRYLSHPTIRITY